MYKNNDVWIIMHVRMDGHENEIINNRINSIYPALVEL